MFGYQNTTGVKWRARNCFSQGFEFYGNIDINIFRQAVNSIIEAIPVFQYKLDVRGTDISKYQWIKKTKEEQEEFEQTDIFTHMKIQNLQQEIDIIFNNGYELLNFGKLPLRIYLFTGYQNDNNSFTIFQLTNHGYGDNKTSHGWFNMIISLYNEYLKGNNGEEILNKAIKQTSISSYDLINKMNSVGFFQNLKNYFSILTCKKGDPGEYSPSIETLQKDLKDYYQKKQEQGSNKSPFRSYHRFNMQNLFKNVKSKQPHVSKNSILTAFILLAIYNYDQSHRYKQIGKPLEKLDDYISFGTAISLLDNSNFENYFGNLITLLQSGFNCKNKTLEQLSVEFQNKIDEIKKNKSHISSFSLLEKIISSNFMLKILGKRNQKASFSITNWTHHQFSSKNKNFLQNCIPKRSYISSFNEPEINDPVLCTIRTPFYIAFVDPDDYLNLTIVGINDQLVSCFSEAIENFYKTLNQYEQFL